MDITTILGILGGFGFIFYGIMDGGEIGNFINIPSITIVIGGTLCTVIASYPFSLLKTTVSHMPKLLRNKEFQIESMLDELMEFAQIARQDGLLALEEKARELKAPFFKQGIMLVVDAMDAEQIRNILEAEVDSMDQRHADAIGMYEKAGAVAPAFGMVGTLVGLINMLNNMSLEAGSSTSIGSDMAVALITTLYGSILANVIFMPIAKKLSVRNEEEIFYKVVLIEGIVGIQGGENPKTLKERLVSLMKQKEREKILNGTGAGKKGKATTAETDNK